MGERRWTLGAARELIGEIRERTQRAVEATDALIAERAAHPAGSPELETLEKKVENEVSRWAREMEALGLEVKGPWLIDFDTGGGYYCWKWPETDLQYFHTYEEGFGGRIRIQ